MMKHNGKSKWLAVPLSLTLFLCVGCSSGIPSETGPASDEVSASLILRYETILQEQSAQIRELLEAIRTGYDDNGKPDKFPSHGNDTDSETESSRIPANETQTDRRAETESNHQDSSETETAAPRPEQLFLWEEIDGGIRITGLSAETKDLVIPARISGQPVLEIADSAFTGKGLRSVHIEEGVQKIGWFAFYGCGSLAVAELPSSVGTIGYSAFDGCASGFIIRCPEGSYAHRYATSFAIRCDAGGY